MIPITAVIPVRLDCPERLTNLWTVTHYLLDQLQFEQVIVVEADVRPRILGSIEHARLRWHYVQVSSSWAWNKGRVVNCALPFVNTRLLALWDADGLLRPQAVTQSIDLLLTNQTDYIVPWSRLLYLKRDAPLIETVRAGQWIEPEMAHVDATSVSNMGLINLTTTALFRHIRGFNELFHGWGGEDSELVARVARLGYRIMRLDLDAAHLHHPRTSSSPNAEFDKLSQGELDRVVAMDSAGVRAYFGVAEKPGRYGSLRRPDQYIKPTTPADVPPPATA